MTILGRKKEGCRARVSDVALSGLFAYRRIAAVCVLRTDDSTVTTTRTRERTRSDVSARRRQQNAVVRVNSVLLAFLNTGSVVGSLAGSLIIGSGRLPGFSTNVDNETAARAVDMSVCGVRHCPYIAAHIKAFASPDPRLVFVVGAVFLLCVGAAFALTVVLRPLPSDRPCCRRGHEVIAEVKGQDGTVSLTARIAGTLRLLVDIRLLLLIPTIVMMGILTSFAIGAFNQVQNNVVAFFDCITSDRLIRFADDLRSASRVRHETFKV